MRFLNSTVAKSMVYSLPVVLPLDASAHGHKWHLGVSAGYGQMHGSIKAESANQPIVNTRASAPAAVGELFAGCGHRYHNVYLGLELNGLLDSTNNRQLSLELLGNSAIRDRITVKHQGQAGITGLLGYVMPTGSKVFFGLGLGWSRWKMIYTGYDHSVGHNFDLTVQNTKNDFILSPSLGFQSELCQGSPWALRATFRYNLPVKPYIAVPYVAAGIQTQLNGATLRGSFAQSQFMLSLIYRFGYKPVAPAA